MTTTLLAVDDSKTMRKEIEITFAGEGFKTVVAADAADAVAKAQSEHPHVALIDAALEGTNGYDLCRQIKGASPSTVVVLLSNKAAEGAQDTLRVLSAEIVERLRPEPVSPQPADAQPPSR